MIETEAKIKIEKGELESLVQQLGQPEFFDQENLVYTLGQSALRIRTEKGRTVITYKGPRQEARFNSRQEIEFYIDSESEEVIELFSQLGLGQPFKYTKQRANFQLNNCTVSLDILGDNLHYIEIEGPESQIEATISQLKLEDKPIESRSYQEILNGMH